MIAARFIYTQKRHPKSSFFLFYTIQPLTVNRRNTPADHFLGDALKSGEIPDVFPVFPAARLEEIIFGALSAGCVSEWLGVAIGGSGAAVCVDFPQIGNYDIEKRQGLFA